MGGGDEKNLRKNQRRWEEVPKKPWKVGQKKPGSETTNCSIRSRDNSGAIAQAKEPRNHHKVRHIDRKYHLIRTIVKSGDVELCKIHMDANVADLLTKPLPQPKHEGHVRAMGIRCLFD